MEKTVKKFERVLLSELVPYARNSRTHSDEQIKQIQASIREFGFVNPILIDSSKNIIAGHGRVLAAKAEGLVDVPCVFVEHLTDTQKKAYMIADNKLALNAGWDTGMLRIELDELEALGFDTSLTGFAASELHEMFEDEAENEARDDNFDPNEALENIDVPIAKPGDIWELGRHRLMCGDSTKQDDVSKLMDGVVADLLLTDPPYNVDHGEKAEAINKYGYGFSPRRIENDKMKDDEFLVFLTSAFENAKESIKPGGAFYIWHASSTLYEFETALRSVGLQTRQQLIWNKNTFVLGRQDYQWKHEPCLYGWKEGAAHHFIDDRTQSTVFEDKGLDLKKLKKDELLSILQEILGDKTSTSVIDEDKPSRNEEHPTMKPIKLLARLIKNSSKQGELVLDLFGGSGSTMITAEQLNRSCYMMEYDPAFCDVIINRWENLTGKKAVKL